MVNRSSKSLELTFHITSNCNLRCTYCYQTHCESGQVIKLETAYKFIDIIIDRKLGKATKLDEVIRDDFDQVDLHFIGGEATLYIDIVDSICSYFFMKCIKNDIKDLLVKSTISLESNGTTYSSDKVKKFINKFKSKLSLSMTTDGCRECFDKCRLDKKGNSVFDIVDGSIRQYIKDFNEVPLTKITVSESNVKYMYESMKYLYSLGHKYVKHSVDCNYAPSDEFLKEYRNQLHKIIEWIVINKLDFYLTMFVNPFLRKSSCRLSSTCGLLEKSSLTIDWNGDLYTCFRFCESSQGNRKRSIGNVDEGIVDHYVIDETLKRRSYPPECMTCECASICSDCPADNYYFNGDISIVHSDCKITKLEYKMACLYQAKVNNIFVK